MAAEGEIVHHDAGFSVVVPEGWTYTLHTSGVRLVGTVLEGGGYPTIRIDAVPASELPEGFLDGRGFQCALGRGGFEYRRWANPLGHGDALTVHLMSEHLSLAVEVEHWSDKLWIDRRFHRREVWPIINSIEVSE